MDLSSVDKILTTTRSVRKRLNFARDVDNDVIKACIEIALQAPTGANGQGWHFLIVDDPQKKAVIADYYKQAWAHFYGGTEENANPSAGQAHNPKSQRAMWRSAAYLAANFEKVPVMIIACVEGRFEAASPLAQASMYGSILPAVWSLMLALRARGLGSAWTTLHIQFEREIGELLGIPDTYTQAVLLPVAHFTGDDFKPADRLPASEVTSWNYWGQDF